MKNVILASASPRRKELLERMGIKFAVIPAKGEERITKNDPGEIVEELAMQKAAEVAASREEAVVIGSDTVVVLDGKILGKPKDEEEAQRMLTSLQGRTHQVYTGVAVIEKTEGKERTCLFHESSDVTFYPMSAEEIRKYIRTKDCFDKAGGYGIQGEFCVYVKGICGDYNNIVGFPVSRFFQEMKKQGFCLTE